MNSDGKQTEKNIVQNADWFLQILVEVVNKGKETFPITLNAGCLIISGDLVGVKEYFNNIMEGEMDEMINELYPDMTDNVNESELIEQSLPSFIHLKDARIYLPGMPPVLGNKGMYWRGRLEAVTGFWLDKLIAETQQI